MLFVGHPFVILEDKENHRHMVPAPDPPDSASDSSADKTMQNGHMSEPGQLLGYKKYKKDIKNMFAHVYMFWLIDKNWICGFVA